MSNRPQGFRKADLKKRFEEFILHDIKCYCFIVNNKGYLPFFHAVSMKKAIDMYKESNFPDQGEIVRQMSCRRVNQVQLIKFLFSEKQLALNKCPFCQKVQKRPLSYHLQYCRDFESALEEIDTKRTMIMNREVISE